MFNKRTVSLVLLAITLHVLNVGFLNIKADQSSKTSLIEFVESRHILLMFMIYSFHPKDIYWVDILIQRPLYCRLLSLTKISSDSKRSEFP